MGERKKSFEEYELFFYDHAGLLTPLFSLMFNFNQPVITLLHFLSLASVMLLLSVLLFIVNNFLCDSLHRNC